MTNVTKPRSKGGWLARVLVRILLAGSLIACGGAPPPATPISVQPTVTADRVPETFDYFFGTDPESFIAAANERLSPTKLPAPAHAAIHTQAERGYRMLLRFQGWSVGRDLFAEKIRGGLVGVIVPRSSEGHLIVPVEWMRRVISIGFADPLAMHDWYVAMIERVATVGKASGIAVLHNGDAMGIEIDLTRVQQTSDCELVVHRKALHAGEYRVEEWGPRIDGEAVSLGTMNGHDGISMEDLLREQLVPQKR